MARRTKMARSSTAGRFIRRAAASGRFIERDSAKRIDQIEEQRAAERYWQMIGADLTLEERRNRDREGISLREQCTS